MSKAVLNIVDEEGNIVGVETREKIHQEGLLHRIVHVWLYTPDKNIIFQRRGKEAESFPNKLDATVGGHVEIGQDYMQAALAETREETGIQARPEEMMLLGLRKAEQAFRDPVTGTLNRHLKAVFAYRFTGDIKSLRPQEGEDDTIRFEAVPISRVLGLQPEEISKDFIPAQFEPDYFDIFQKINELL